MLNSRSGFLGFGVGVGLTIGLLLSPHLLPWGYRAGFNWSGMTIIILGAAGVFIFWATLLIGNKLINGAASWKEPRLIAGVVLIAFVANGLFTVLVELFALKSGWRALVAVLGVPVIYGKLGAVLGQTGLKESMLNIFSGALATMGAGFIIVALIHGW